MATTTPQQRAHSAGPRFDPRPGKLRYSLRWLSALAGGGTLATLAFAMGGTGAAAALGALGATGVAYATMHEPRRPRIERVTLHHRALPADLDGLRIGHLSDLHLGMRFTAANSRWAAERMLEEAPDLLALTGDFVSYARAIPTLAHVLAPLARLTPRLGIYAVPGNHDYWEGVAAIRRALAPLGVRFLLNEHVLLERGGARLLVAGVDDQWSGRPDLGAALAGGPDGAFRVLLAHCPDIADEAAARGVHVQLSGHTHGGHVRAPGLGALCLPRHGWRYTIGHERIGAMQLYVSRGLGGVPLRFGCPPEATVITLRRG
ncbi:MAG: metallophosphoesterase [Chloroflexi bacterium OHK40]